MWMKEWYAKRQKFLLVIQKMKVIEVPDVWLINIVHSSVRSFAPLYFFKLASVWCTQGIHLFLTASTVASSSTSLYFFNNKSHDLFRKFLFLYASLFACHSAASFCRQRKNSNKNCFDIFDICLRYENFSQMMFVPTLPSIIELLYRTHEK